MATEKHGRSILAFLKLGVGILASLAIWANNASSSLLQSNCGIYPYYVIASARLSTLISSLVRLGRRFVDRNMVGTGQSFVDWISSWLWLTHICNGILRRLHIYVYGMDPGRRGEKYRWVCRTRQAATDMQGLTVFNRTNTPQRFNDDVNIGRDSKYRKI